MERVIFRKGVPMTVHISDCDLWTFERFAWRILKYASGFRIARMLGEKGFYFHREILGFPTGEIDHKNGDGLDNRRENLRVCSRLENNRNQRKSKRPLTSKYKGVSWDKKSKKWLAHISIMNKCKYLGVFSDEWEAALAYNKAAEEKFGEFACLNEIAV